MLYAAYHTGRASFATGSDVLVAGADGEEFVCRVGLFFSVEEDIFFQVEEWYGYVSEKQQKRHGVGSWTAISIGTQVMLPMPDRRYPVYSAFRMIRPVVLSKNPQWFGCSTATHYYFKHDIFRSSSVFDLNARVTTLLE